MTALADKTISVIGRHHQEQNVGQRAPSKNAPEEISSTPKRRNENRSPAEDEIQDISDLSGEQVQSFKSIKPWLKGIHHHDDEVSLTPSMHDNVLNNIEANAGVNQAELLNFVRKSSSSSQLQEFMGIRPKVARQHASARRIGSSRTLSDPSLSASTSQKSEKEASAKLTTGFEVTLIPENLPQERQLPSIKEEKERERTLSKISLPLSCIGCVVGNSHKESELEEFRKWKKYQHALELQRLNCMSDASNNSFRDTIKPVPKHVEFKSDASSSKHDSKSSLDDSNDYRQESDVVEDKSADPNTASSVREETVKKVSFLSDILDRKEMIGADYSQVVDDSVKKIKGLLTPLQDETTEQSLEQRYHTQDLKESVQTIKEKLTRMDRRMWKGSFEEPEAIFLADSESFGNGNTNNKAVALSQRFPLFSCINFDYYDDEIWNDYTFDTFEDPGEFTYYDYDDATPTSYRNGKYLM